MLCLGGLLLQPLCAPVVPHRPALFLGLGAVALSKDHPVLLETPLLSPLGMNSVGGLMRRAGGPSEYDPLSQSSCARRRPQSVPSSLGPFRTLLPLCPLRRSRRTPHRR